MSEHDTPTAQAGSTGAVHPAALLPVPAKPVLLAVGIDLVERARVAAVYSRFGERFLRRVFTPGELERAHGQIERLAGRFAAKEACAKALGTGIGQVSWQEIEIDSCRAASRRCDFRARRSSGGGARPVGPGREHQRHG